MNPRMKPSFARTLFLWLVIACSLSSHAQVAPESKPNEVELAVARLQTQLNLLEAISAHVQREDLGHLVMLANATRAVITSIEVNGLAHQKTFKVFQQQIVMFRYSTAVFVSIQTEESKHAIQTLAELTKSIQVAHGFDDTAYSQITLNVFSQMDALLQNLQELPLSEPVRAELRILRPKMGVLLAEAGLGDRPSVFELSIPMAIRIKDLDPLFAGISSSDPAFEIVLEIQGLNAVYREFAQVSRYEAKQEPKQ